MRISLAIPYADTSADRLSFTLDLPELPALDAIDIPEPLGPGSALSLRLLGASHQAVLCTPRASLLETLACLPDREPALPSTVDESVGGLGYRFALRVDRMGPRRFRRAVTEVRDGVARDPYGLVGVFPGDPDAVTALLAEPREGGLRWLTWHAYPQTGELVATRTAVSLRGSTTENAHVIGPGRAPQRSEAGGRPMTEDAHVIGPGRAPQRSEAGGRPMTENIEGNAR